MKPRIYWAVETSLSYLQTSYRFCIFFAGIRQIGSYLFHFLIPERKSDWGNYCSEVQLQANYITCTNLHMLFHAFSQEQKSMLARLAGGQVVGASWRCQMIASFISTHIRGSSWSEIWKQKWCTLSTSQFPGWRKALTVAGREKQRFSCTLTDSSPPRGALWLHGRKNIVGG